MKKEQNSVSVDGIGDAERPFMRVLTGGRTAQTPIWLMRQAGRYLPEYRKTRETAGSFLDLCYRPDLAAEVTLQPIRRFGFDAAILFADILLVPHGLGQELAFREGEGPVLEPIRRMEDIQALSLDRSLTQLSSIATTLRQVREALPGQTSLIGFAGAPFTVASYMVAGHGTLEQAPARLMAYRAPDLFQAVIDLLVSATIAYLLMQIEAGADALQIFDSWAGSLPEGEFERWVIDPNRRIVEGIKAKAPNIPIIGFARGAGSRQENFARKTLVDAVSLETQISAEEMSGLAEKGFTVQGNLDPLVLIAGGEILSHRVRAIRDAMKGHRHIFNLGHGILPETPIGHVEQLIDLVRAS